MSDNNYHDPRGVPRFHLVLSTGLGTGFLPLMPGTWGALLALGVWYLLYLCLSPVWLTVVTMILVVATTVVGAWTSGVMERYWGEDPRTVNIDEFVGTWIPLLVAPCGDHTWLLALLGFGLFRVIDMWKPLGCRSMERFGKGWGVMLDDVLAGTYALIVLLVVKLVFFPGFEVLPL